MRRVAARERRVLDRLLPAAGPAVLRQGGARVHELRPVLRVVPRADVPEPLLLAVGGRPTASTTPYQRVDLPTIFDRFAAKGIPAAYYYGSFAFLLLYQRYQAISHPYSRFFAQCKTGKLPAFSYIDPNWTFQDSGPSSGSEGNDDHPHADIRAGEYFLSTIYNAVTRSPAWSRTLLVITFDEWGGFFDHVPPPAAAADANPAYVQRGFRVPCLLISPFARRGHVAHGVYDHTSILKLAEWRWGLAPLTPRDASATNLASALDFSRRNLAAPRIAVPRVVVGAACPA